ncbi:hypothetical protein pb186bvf_019285 [Paramecium bursaria]
MMAQESSQQRIIDNLKLKQKRLLQQNQEDESNNIGIADDLLHRNLLMLKIPNIPQILKINNRNLIQELLQFPLQKDDRFTSHFFELQAEFKMKKTLVAIRLKEGQNDQEICLKKTSDKNISFKDEQNQIFDLNFGINNLKSIDQVFDSNQETQEIFNKMVLPMIEDSLNGQNQLLCLYGQSGSGKTYSFNGILQLLAGHLFSKQQVIDYLYHQQIQVSLRLYEIHLEKLIDLLDYSKFKRNKTSCREEIVYSLEQFEQIHKQGIKRVHTAQIARNKQSSRSHTIIEFEIRNGQYLSTFGIVDLAGPVQYNNNHLQLEAGHINKSLSTLSHIILKMKQNQQQKKNCFINYRETCLTNCLKDFLINNCRLGFIICINMTDKCKSSLEFAKNAYSIEREVQRNSIQQKKEQSWLTDRILQLEDEIENQLELIKHQQELIKHQQELIKQLENKNTKLENQMKGMINQQEQKIEQIVMKDQFYENFEIEKQEIKEKQDNQLQIKDLAITLRNIQQKYQIQDEEELQLYDDLNSINEEIQQQLIRREQREKLIQENDI